jgi:hypothetical protein
VAGRVLSEEMTAEVFPEDSGLATDPAEMERIILVSNDHALDVSHAFVSFRGTTPNGVVGDFHSYMHMAKPWALVTPLLCNEQRQRSAIPISSLFPFDSLSDNAKYPPVDATSS